MAELKTKPNNKSVDKFVRAVTPESKREDAYSILKMMKSITRTEPRMWGESIVGFGTYHYKYATGREGDWPMTGFSPRKQNLTIYVMPGFERFESLMKKLGKHKTGVSCLYIKSLDQVDTKVLRQLIRESYRYMKAKYGSSR